MDFIKLYRKLVIIETAAQAQVLFLNSRYGLEQQTASSECVRVDLYNMFLLSMCDSVCKLFSATSLVHLSSSLTVCSMIK